MNKKLRIAVDAAICATLCRDLDINWETKKKLHEGIQAAVWDYLNVDMKDKKQQEPASEAISVPTPITAHQAREQTEALQAHRSTLAGVMEDIDRWIADAIDCYEFETSWTVEDTSPFRRLTPEVHKLLTLRGFRITVSSNSEEVEARKNARQKAIQQGRRLIPKEKPFKLITTISW
jgi:hypothetical protein